jgi:hypothetical protein
LEDSTEIVISRFRMHQKSNTANQIQIKSNWTFPKRNYEIVLGSFPEAIFDNSSRWHAIKMDSKEELDQI